MELHASGTEWAIATPHTVATEAGAGAFERGGNALDAALAAAVALAVSYPHNCGVGGDLFALVYRPDGTTIAINASGRAPAGVDPSAMRARYGTMMPQWGPDPITVPGAVSGWATLHAEGARLPWHEAFVAAIALAHDGVTLSRSTAGALEENTQRFATDRGLAGVFFTDGAPFPRGALVRQPALGTTLQQLAHDGPSALYGGSIGERYAAGLRAAGSPMTSDDLAAHRADIVAPLVGRYRDLDVRVVPPNSQGFALLQMLALTERLGIDPDPLGSDAGALALAFSAANRDRDRHLADAEAMRVHALTLLDDGHLAGLAGEVRDRDPRAIPGISGHRHGTGDTIALVAADAQGWAVSLIQSLYDSFGAGILEPDTGIVAQDRGACFTLEAGHPNEIGPRKRPFHTLMPALVHRDGRLAAVAGSMGGASQPQINAQNLIRAFDLGMPAAEAIAAPRWTVWSEDAPFARVEGSVPGPVADLLSQAGFRIEAVADLDEAVGHAHLIMVRPDGSFDVGSDPRADGGALAT
jgi:gamma-glutamyltranspeptidase/glutathione hydrolase